MQRLKAGSTAPAMQQSTATSSSNSSHATNASNGVNHAVSNATQSNHTSPLLPSMRAADMTGFNIASVLDQDIINELCDGILSDPNYTRYLDAAFAVDDHTEGDGDDSAAIDS